MPRSRRGSASVAPVAPAGALDPFAALVLGTSVRVRHKTDTAWHLNNAVVTIQKEVYRSETARSISYNVTDEHGSKREIETRFVWVSLPGA